MFVSRSHAVAEAMDKLNTPVLMVGMDEPVPRFKLGLVMSFDKLRTNGFLPFMVSLLNHQSLKHPDLGWLH
jgi:hypothetical protein